MCRYKKWTYVRSFEVEGNRGGDYLRLTETDEDGILNIEVGHTGVVTVRTQVPVVLLTTVLSELVIDPVRTAKLMRELWPGYGDKLAEFIKALGPWKNQDT